MWHLRLGFQLGNPRGFNTGTVSYLKASIAIPTVFNRMKSPWRKNGLEGKWKGTAYPGRDFPTHSTLHFQQTSPWKSEAAHLILAWPLETGGANLPDLDKAQFLEALNCIKLPVRTGAIWTVQAPKKVCILPVISTPQIYRL